jgi:hypothetical protein
VGRGPSGLRPALVVSASVFVGTVRGHVFFENSISRSKFQRWSMLANKHFPWLMGPLGSLLINYAFGVPGPG